MGSSLCPARHSHHPRKRTGGASNSIGDGVCLLPSLSKHSVDGGATAGGDAGARIMTDPTTTPVAISLAPTTGPPATGLARSPSVRPPERLGPSCCGPVFIAPGGSPGHRLPLVALVLQWRQDHPNNRPPTRATANSAMGQVRAPRTSFGGEGNWCKVQSRAANGMCRSLVN
jgi:hypothetical protein